MPNWYMLTLVGRDRPGIVARVTTALFEAGCNLGESSMIRLGDNFTIMMMAQSERDREALREALQPVASELGLVLHVDAVEAGRHQRPVPDVRILVHGADRAGIVARVTSLAADAGLNILDLESDVGGTDSEPIYILQIEGTAEHGQEAIEQALAPLQSEGVRVDVQSVDTLIG
ncbi:MAG TPA: ACT domain-containing protein [Gammaproteobacteria bacterium]|nr:ACT domain-containing protein [Gammaproteobacteria bacterium]